MNPRTQQERVRKDRPYVAVQVVSSPSFDHDNRDLEPRQGDVKTNASGFLVTHPSAPLILSFYRGWSGWIMASGVISSLIVESLKQLEDDAATTRSCRADSTTLRLV